MEIIDQQRKSIQEQNKRINAEQPTTVAPAIENLASENAKLTNLIEQLRGDVHKQLEKPFPDHSTRTPSSPSYADMINKKPPPKLPDKTRQIQKTNAKLKPIIFVKPEEGQSIKQLERKFTDKVDPSTSRIRATIKSTRNGLMIIGEDQSEIQKLTNMECVKNNFKIEHQAKQNPSLILYGVYSEMKNEEIIEKLVNQNIKDEKLYEEAKQVTKPKFRTGPRKQERDHLVIETSNRVRLYLLEKAEGKVFINFERFAIKDFLSIPKCFRCISYGHVEKHCRVPKQICKYCGKDNHECEKCPDKNREQCVPCLRTKRECGAKNEADCPSYKTAKERAISRINYG